MGQKEEGTTSRNIKNQKIIKRTKEKIKTVESSKEKISGGGPKQFIKTIKVQKKLKNRVFGI